ncbi:hypothetical protein [Pontibacillus yanchengensis]|uniref:hypothetical protein n=1 Tax=Pontibacillus yanchengensis TaxID=462910 RepID=UPI000AAC8FE6|nr:hypothetical protein [Pontibacillus yanchengensis]
MRNLSIALLIVLGALVVGTILYGLLMKYSDSGDESFKPHYTTRHLGEMSVVS